MKISVFILRLLVLFFVGNHGHAIEPDDLLGRSEFCKNINQETRPESCRSGTTLFPQPTRPLEEFTRFQSKVFDLETINLTIKKSLFEVARISFVENLAIADWISSEPVSPDKSLLGLAIKKAKKSCSGPLSERLGSILASPTQRSLNFPLNQTTDKNLRNILQKKYLLAFAESSRLRRLLQDNYLRGPTKLLAQQRLQKLEVSFPMTAQIQPPLLAHELEAEFGIQTQEMNSVIEGDWLDEYLFPDSIRRTFKTIKAPPSSKNKKDCNHLACTSTGLIAQKIDRLESLPDRAEKTLLAALRGNLVKSVESFAFLCKADPCTTFSVNREITAKATRSIFDPIKQTQLQKAICECKILDPSELISPNQTLGLLGTGVALGLTCFGSPATGGILAGAAAVACPSMAVVFAGLGAIQTTANAQTFFRGDKIQRISDYLPGLSSEQRAEGGSLNEDALKSQVTEVAINVGTLGATKIAAPYVVRAGNKAREFVKNLTKPTEITSDVSSGMTSGITSDAAKAERRVPEKKFQGSEKRASTLPSISQIPADNLKAILPSQWPALPSHLRILQGTRKNGEVVHYFESAEKLKDGSVQISWGELYFDKLTGALDCNYAGCRKFFEKMVQAKAGKSHIGFLDVAVVGKTNSEFKAGRKAGDALIVDVYNKILKAGEGKISVVRWGGDEFLFEIAETNPFKVQAILKKIQSLVKDDLEGPGMQIFKDERKAREAAYQAKPTPENKARLKDLEKIYGPDISLGSAQVGAEDSLDAILQAAESRQATVSKISNKLHHGLSAEKYGDLRPPLVTPDVHYRPFVRAPIQSPSWRKPPQKPIENPDWNNLHHLEMTPVADSEKRFGDSVLAVYKDPQGNLRTMVTRWEEIPGASGRRIPIQVEIPTRGNTGVIDAGHPESQRLIATHFTSEKDKVMLGIKLNNLHTINYFEQGTKAGDKILDAIGDTIRKNTRAGDLTSKMGGKDFFQNLETTSTEGVLEIQKRIRKEISEHPVIKATLEEERRLLSIKLAEAKARGSEKEVKRINDKIETLATFEPQILIEHIRNGLSEGPKTFDEIIGTFENLFRAHNP